MIVYTDLRVVLDTALCGALDVGNLVRFTLEQYCEFLDWLYS